MTHESSRTMAERKAILALHPALLPGVTPATPGPDEPEGIDVAVCSSCRARVIWVLTESDERMPLDASADPDGLWVIADPEADTPRIRPFWPLFDGGRARFTSHFATCPYADQHRKKADS